MKFDLFCQLPSVFYPVLILPFGSTVKLGVCTIKPSNIWVKARASHDVSLLSVFFFCCNSLLIASTFFNFGIMIYWRWHFFWNSWHWAEIWYDYFAVIINLFILNTLVYNISNHFFGYVIINWNDFLTGGCTSIQQAVCAIWWHRWTGRKFRLQHAVEPSWQRDEYPIVELILTPTSTWPCHIRFIDDSFNSTETFAK